jgi:branched-chain amino acid transport system substrate-binding protein
VINVKRIAPLVALALLAAACATAARASGPLVLGAVYPVHGGQGPGGTDEFHGVQLAAEYVNAHGGVDGRSVRLDLQAADSSDQAPRAVDALARAGVPVILGSYGSTISQPAAARSAAHGIMYWETGAVGLLNEHTLTSDLVFRFSPTGASLGRAAVRFAHDRLLPALHADANTARFGVVYVNDIYGNAVASGMVDQIRDAHGTLVGRFPYDLQHVSYTDLVKRIVAARVQVLGVVAYEDDGVALRKEMVKERVPLIASIGTSSSYCMPMFGEELGKAAVGLYASDKPDGDVLDASKLAPEAGAALRWARAQFKLRFHKPMSAAALTGFSGAWALMRYVLPNAQSMTARAIANAARSVSLSEGSLPNGSGLAFAPVGQPGNNLRAASVIWEWVKVGTRAVVWPPAFATSPIVPLRIQ